MLFVMHLTSPLKVKKKSSGLINVASYRIASHHNAGMAIWRSLDEGKSYELLVDPSEIDSGMAGYSALAIVEGGLALLYEQTDTP